MASWREGKLQAFGRLLDIQPLKEEPRAAPEPEGVVEVGATEDTNPMSLPEDNVVAVRAAAGADVHLM